MELVLAKLFFGALLSFLFTYYLVPLCIKIAHKYRILDVPDGQVKMHKMPTPYLGGVAVYLGFLNAIALVFPFDNQFFLFLIGATLLFYVGLIDDLIALRPSQKFAGQAIAVLCFIKAGFYLKAHIFYHFWSVPISIFWMLLVINAFNLIDIMDGLATLVALCCTVNFLVLALISQEYLVALLLCAMLGALTAYFIFNKPVAKIYLGDAGSLFIGGILSSLPFLFSWGNFHPYGYIIPLVILAIPLLEVFFLICIRTYKGIPFYNASKDHFALYLKRKGFSEWEVLLFVLCASCVLTTSSVLFAKQAISLAALISMGVLFLFMWVKVVFF